MPTLPDRGDNFLFDTLVYLGTVFLAFGLGWRLDTWLANDAYAAPLFYTALLFLVYVKWVMDGHE